MAFSIADLLTAEQRDYMQRMSQRIEELHGFDNLSLGQELLKLTLEARQLYPDRLANGDEGYGNYTTSLFWDVVPEVAKRLGVTIFGQKVRDDVRRATDHELRNWVGQCIGNAGWSPNVGHHNEMGQPLCPWELLTHEACNGNPLAFAIDRLAPVAEYDRDDVLSRSIHEISRTRGFEPMLTWEPAMNAKPNPRELAAMADTEEEQTLSFGM
jgi:hypothetical protein